MHGILKFVYDEYNIAFSVLKLNQNGQKVEKTRCPIGLVTETEGEFLSIRVTMNR